MAEGPPPRGYNPTLEGMGLLMDHPVIEGDGERSDSIWASGIRHANDLAEGFMDRGSWEHPSSYPGFLFGAGLQGLTAPFLHNVNGEDVTVGDVGLAAAEVLPGAIGPTKRGISGALGWLARPQNITQRIAKHEIDAGIEPSFGDWYKSYLAPYLRAGAMPFRAVGDMVKRLKNSDLDALYRKHKISPSQKEEMLKNIEWAQNNPNSASRMNDNELISQMQYIDVAATKYGGAAFARDLKKILSPRTVATTGDDISRSGIPIGRIVDSDLPADVVRDHMGQPLVDSFGLGGKKVSLNTHALNETSPIKVMMHNSNKSNAPVKVGGSPAYPAKGNSTYFYHGTEGEYNPAATAMMLWKRLPEGTPFSKVAILKEAKAYNRQVKEGLLEIEESIDSLIKYNKDGSISRKGYSEGKDSLDGAYEKASKLRETYLRMHPFVDVEHLESAAKQSGGYISFPSRVLGEDRLLGHYDLRTIIKEGTDEGYVFISDEMALGLGGKVDRVLGARTPEWIGVDLIPLSKSDGSIHGVTSTGAAAGQRGIEGMKETSLRIQEELLKMFDAKATGRDKLITNTKRAAVAGTGGAIGYSIWGDDSE